MKSVLVIEKPESCIDCRLCIDDSCFITETVIKDGINEDCPLKDLPQRQVANEYDFEHYSNGVAIGWNRCLEKISGTDYTGKDKTKA